MLRRLIAAVLLALASPVAAQFSTPGVPSIGGSGAFAYPGVATAAYVPGAVTFTPETGYGVFQASLGANGGTDTSHMIVSWWERAHYGSTPPANIDANWGAYLNDTFGNGAETPTPACNSETCPGHISVVDNATTSLTLRENWNDSVGGSSPVHAYEGQCSGCAVPWNDTWHHYLIVTDTGYASGLKRSALYVDGVKNTAYAATEVGTPTGSFNIDINSPNGWAFNNHTNSGISSGAFDIADLFMDTGTSWTTLASTLGCASVIDGSNNVCAALVAKFYSAGPVDIGGSSNCSLPLGRQPELCFSGGKTTWTNKGNATGTWTYQNGASLTGGVGSGVATPALYNASFGPAGPPTNRPYFTAVANGHLTGPTAGMTTFTTAINSNGMPIATGDLLCVAVTLADTSTSFNRAITTATTGWSAVSMGGAGNPVVTTGTHPLNAALFCHTAGVGDVTASGSNMSAPPVITWTANANALRTASWVLFDYRGANATSPVQVAASVANPSTTTVAAAPTVTTTSAPATLVTIYNYFSCVATYPPATQDVRFKRYSAPGCAIATSMVSDEALVSIGATGTRSTLTQGSAEASVGMNVVLTQ